MPEANSSIQQLNGTTTNTTTKTTNICIGCGQFIQDQFIYKVLPDMQWHENCLKCSACDCKLKENSTCFIKNGKAYCKTDYIKLFSTKCNRCGDIIKRNDLVMNSKAKIYHYECFCCNVCNKKLLPGDEYQIRDDQLLCKDDALSSVNQHQHSQSYQTTSNTQLYLSNLNGYNTSTIAITPENSVHSSSSYSPSNNSSSSSVIDSPNNQSYANSSFNISNNLTVNSHYNNYQQSFNENNYEFQDKEEDGSVSDDDDLDNDEDDNDNSISEESSLNESVNSNGMKNKIKKNNLKSSQSNKQLYQSNFSSSNSLLKMHGNSHKPARIRTVLNEKQLHTLRACYGANPRPDALMKEQLVEMTGLNPRVIRVWFQNKRCKDKKKNMLVRPDQMGMNHPHQQLHNIQYHNNHPMANIPNHQHNLMYDNCY